MSVFAQNRWRIGRLRHPFPGDAARRRSGKSLALRMDDRRQRVVVSEDGGEGVGLFWLGGGGCRGTRRMAARLDDERGETGRARLARACARTPREGPDRARRSAGQPARDFPRRRDQRASRSRPGRSISGFRYAARSALGHAVLHVKDINDAGPFYRDVLGFRLSDFMARPSKAYFFHANPRHHSIASSRPAAAPRTIMVGALRSSTTVGAMLRSGAGRGGRIGVTPAVTSTTRSPRSIRTRPGFMVEYGWGGRVIDVAGWQPEEVTWGPSMWGTRPHVDDPGEAARRRARSASRPHSERAAQAGQRDRGQLHAGRRLPLVDGWRAARRRSNRAAALCPRGGESIHFEAWLRRFRWVLSRRWPRRYAAIFTYSKSPGLLSMPTRGGAIQLANLPGSVTGCISAAMKSPSSFDGSHLLLRPVPRRLVDNRPLGDAFTSLNSPIWRWNATCGSSKRK